MLDGVAAADEERGANEGVIRDRVLEKLILACRCRLQVAKLNEEAGSVRCAVEGVRSDSLRLSLHRAGLCSGRAQMNRQLCWRAGRDGGEGVVGASGETWDAINPGTTRDRETALARASNLPDRVLVRPAYRFPGRLLLAPRFFNSGRTNKQARVRSRSPGGPGSTESTKLLLRIHSPRPLPTLRAPRCLVSPSGNGRPSISFGIHAAVARPVRCQGANAPPSLCASILLSPAAKRRISSYFFRGECLTA